MSDVLVVDDEEAIRHILRRILEKNGCQVQVAGSAEEALNLLTNYRPSVALLDIVLPGMNGLELLQRLRKLSGDTEVLVMTSHSSAETALKALRSGAFDYLEKPFDDLTDVWIKVQRALEKRNLSQKHREVLREQHRKSQELSSAVSRVDPQRTHRETEAAAHPCEDLIQDFVELAVNELDAAQLSVYLLDEESGELSLAASHGLTLPDGTAPGLRPGQGIPGAVLQTGEPFLLSRDDAASVSARKGSVDASHPVLCTPIDLSVPLKTETRVLGVVNISRTKAGQDFTSDGLGFLTGLASQLAAAIDATTQSHRLQKAYETLESTQAQLLTSERTKAFAQMAAGVAHDFNNALGVILARAELGIHDLGAGTGLDGLREHLEIIKNTSLQSAEMVKRIQDYSKTRRDVPEKPVDLNTIVRDAVEMSRPKWKDACEGQGKSVEVRSELSEIPIVRGNVYELTQVVNNLIFNAVEAMPEGGSLTFRSRAEGEHIVLEVGDTGTGMDEETRRRLFDPFFTTKPFGQGLGMSVVSGIVARHQGQIDVCSTPGKGTTFRIALPRPDLPLEEPAHETSRSTSGALGSVRILLVDDDELVLDTYTVMLSSQGHQVLGAPNGSAALALLRDEAFDILVTDVSMSGMTGFELARRAKEQHPHLPVILLTGWVGQEQEDKLSASEVDGILAKPCLLEDMLEAIHKAVQPAARASTGNQA